MAAQAKKEAPGTLVIKSPEPKDGKPRVRTVIVGAPPTPAPAENVTYVYARPDKAEERARRPEPMPSVSGNLSAMPADVVDYIRFVRAVEEGRQTAAADRHDRLAGKSASDPVALAEARRAVKDARERLSRLRARAFPNACRRLRRNYEKALVLDGAQAEQDAALLAQAVSAAKAGDSRAAQAFAGQAGDPARLRGREEERGLTFGAADAALVELMGFYPNSPADFASIRFGDQPF